MLTPVAKQHARLICLAIFAVEARSRKYCGNMGVSSSIPMLKLKIIDVENRTLFKKITQHQISGKPKGQKDIYIVLTSISATIEKDLNEMSQKKVATSIIIILLVPQQQYLNHKIAFKESSLPLPARERIGVSMQPYPYKHLQGCFYTSISH